MSIHFKRLLLRANAIFLLAASTGGFLSDVRGIFFGLGPVGRVVAQAPDAGIGFIEAHGLAFILGVLLWRAESLRSWHPHGRGDPCPARNRQSGVLAALHRRRHADRRLRDNGVARALRRAPAACRQHRGNLDNRSYPSLNEIISHLFQI